MFPVKKNIVRIAQLSFLIALISCSPCAVFAQSNIGQNSIVEIREDRAKTSAALLTSSKKPLPRPIIQFLAGENGNTVLVADFNDVVFPFSTRVINVNATPIAGHATMGSAERDGIRLVRIGKFQESPPVCRVAIVSSDPDKLRAVTFDSRPGSLLIKWPKSFRITSNGSMPPQAPSFAERSQSPHRRAYQTNYSPPPVYQPAGEMDPAISEIPQLSQGRIDPEIASANNLGLRGAMPAPVNPQNYSREYNNPLYPQRASGQGLAAKAQSLNGTPPKASSPVSPPKSSWQKTAKENSTDWKDDSNSQQSQRLAKADTAPRVAPDRFAAARLSEKSANSKSNKSGRTTPQSKPVVTDTVSEERSEERPGLVSDWFAKVKDKTRKLLASENPDNQTQEVQSLKNDSKKSLETVSPDKKEEISPGDEEKNGIDSQFPNQPDDGKPPAVFLTQNSSGTGYIIKIVSPDKRDLNFSSFRLHNPERFVIDLEGLRSVQTIDVPQPDNTEILKSIRVGAPEPGKNTGRLVLDLATPLVSVIPGDAASVNEVSFAIGQSSDPLVGLSPPPGSVVVLDAGHGGTDPGAQRGYVKEKELTLAIAQKTREKLIANGIKVVMTRGDDTFIPLPERVNITNSSKPDMFLSVHINSLESTNDIHGIETYYQTDMSKALAQQIHDSLVVELAAPDRAIRKAKFYVINRAEVPAVLAEVGFISNKAERDKLVSEDYQEKVAGALAKGAILYLKQHSSVAGKISRTSEQPSGSLSRKQLGNTIPRASELAQKGLGIKSH